jgi:serine/threonine-protein kinase/endoribonuclease IRE1
MVAFYLVTKGKHPFGGKPDQPRNLFDGKPVGLETLKDPVLKDLLSWMLSHVLEDRPSAEEALKHPYLQPKKQQFKMLCKVGKEPEIQMQDGKSDVVQRLNSDPADWKTLISADVLKYFYSDFPNGSPKTIHYGSSWTECLRFIENVSRQWHNQTRPKPQPDAFYSVNDPQEYFLNIFPTLVVRVHIMIRSSDWKKRADLKEYFTKGTVCVYTYSHKK